LTILNERILRLIVTLADELHFSRAAAALHVSQPALSGTIKNLERDLGVRLFKRTSRNVELTEAGHVLVAEAHRLLSESERAVALVRGSSSDILGPLQIGYPPSFNLPWLASLISSSRHDPSLNQDLNFISGNAVTLQEELVKRILQAAFISGSIYHPDLECVKLFKEDFHVVLPSRHPLAGRSSLRIDEVHTEPVMWLCRDVNPHLYDAFIKLCSSQGYRPNIVQEVRTFYECLQLARAGLGITFLPAFMRTGGSDDAVVFTPLANHSLYVEYNLAYLRSGPSHGVDRFVVFVQNHLPKKNLPASGSGH